MPRKKFTAPIVIGNDGPAATSKSRARKMLTDLRTETGDPWDDGEIWLNRIMQARRARGERENGEKQWRQYYRWYKGKHWNDRGEQGGTTNADNARSTATVNKTGSIITSFVPFTINDEIKFLLEAEKETTDNGTGVKIQQGLLNYEWRRRKMTRQMKACARDYFIIGHCVAKAGYTVEVDESKLNDDTINYADYIIKDAPFVERINPLNFLFDTNGKDHTLHTARWCAEYFFVPYVDVLSNKSYDPETLGMFYAGDAGPTTQSAWETQIDGGRRRKERPLFGLPEDRLVSLIEIWDWKTKQRIVMADGCARPLLVEKWPYGYLDKFPYAMATLIEVPNEPYGLGVPAWIEDQQNQLNRANTLEQDIARQSRPQRYADPELDSKELDKFKEGDDVVSARKDQIGVIQAADLSQMFQVYKQNIERVIEEMTGADALLQGSRLPSRTTAGEIGTRARLTGLKIDQHVEDFEEFVEDIATQVLAHLKKFRTVNDVIKIVGDEGAEWVPYTNEQIQDDVEVDVEYFAAPKTDIELEKQQGLQIVELGLKAIPLLAQTGAEMTIDPVQLFGFAFDRFGEKDISRFFKSSRTGVPGVPEGAGTQNGLPPDMAGALAPAPIPGTPGVGAPGEGLEAADLMQSMRGLAQ